MNIQWPGGVGVPGPSAQKLAMASSSRVPLSTYFRTSASSWAISGDDVEGGGAGRSATICSGVSIHARTLPKNGSIGGRAGLSMLCHGMSPRTAARAGSVAHSAGEPPAAPMPSEAARATNIAAMARPSATPAAMSLAVALPDSSAA